ARAEAVVHDVEARWAQGRAVQGAVDVERPADEAGSGAAADAGAGLERAHQDRLGEALGTGDEVQAVVHAVDEVDVRVPGGAVHDGGPGGEPAPGVGGPVGGTAVGLDLHQPAPAGATVHLADDQLAQEVAGHVQGV